MTSKFDYSSAVIDVVKLIPKGRVTTYGAIADFLSLGSARMVGWALNKSGLVDNSTPAHRVVNRKGELSGRNAFRDSNYMQTTLESEGLHIIDNVIQKFDQHFWHPEQMINS